MKITSVKTHKILAGEASLLEVLDTYLPEIKEQSVVAVTSKVVSVCEGRVVKIGEQDKDELIKKECELYLSREKSKYGFSLTIKNNLLIPTAGIDESNGNGYYILWPKDPQKSANEVRAYLQKRFSLANVGVLITDSKTTLLRLGVTGVGMAHSGFKALNDFRGKPDIFGRALKVTQVNVMDALAAATVLAMGESNEQTPLCVIEDVPFVQFQRENPSQEELAELRIALEDDLYAPLLTSVPWEKGHNGT